MYVRDELESLGLWDEEQTQDGDICSNSIDENVNDRSSMNDRYNSCFNSEPNCGHCLVSIKVDCWKKWRKQTTLLFVIKQSKLSVE